MKELELESKKIFSLLDELCDREKELTDEELSLELKKNI